MRASMYYGCDSDCNGLRDEDGRFVDFLPSGFDGWKHDLEVQILAMTDRVALIRYEVVEKREGAGR